MTATITHPQHRRWTSSVALIVALAAVIITVVALAVGAHNNSDSTSPKPTPVATESAATQSSCSPRVVFSRC